MTSEGGEKPILHVDEDWKNRVEEEKKKVLEQRHATAQADSTTEQAEDSSSAGEVPGADAPREPVAPATESESVAQPRRSREVFQMPPASLTFLMTTIASQAMIALGELANPLTGTVETSLEQARHFIDTLAMLESKTEGNRTPEESALLRGVLNQLRMSYLVHERGGSAPS